MSTDGGGETCRALDLLNAMRFEGVATVRDEAQPCAIPTAPLLPRMRSRTVTHRRTATEPPQRRRRLFSYQPSEQTSISTAIRLPS